MVKSNRPRILVMGSPIMYPHLKIPLLIEEMGGMLAADETCTGERALYGPLTVTDRSLSGMMRALAGCYTGPCTCPTFTDNRQRIFRIKQRIKDHQIQGVLYHVLRGCLIYTRTRCRRKNWRKRAFPSFGWRVTITRKMWNSFVSALRRLLNY